MDEFNLSVVGNTRLYSKDVDSGEKIGMLVRDLTNEVSDIGEKINFNDTELVRRTTLRYLQSCERTGKIPTKIGLARACGCSRRAFERFIQRHPDHTTTAFLEVAIDAFSEALSQASLNGSVQPIVSIFLQKAIYGMRENDQVATPQDNPLGEATSTEDLMKKYAELTSE